VKNTYWLIGPDNTFVQVEGAARRDQITSDGWTETTEPTGADEVWMRHEVTGVYSLMRAGALDAWQGRGWQYAVPPTRRTEQGVIVALPESVQQPQSAVADTPDVTTPQAEEPPASDEKEKPRGR